MSLSIYGWKPHLESNHLTIFGNHYFSTSGDKKYLMYHVTLQNYIIEGSRNFMGGSSTWYVTTVPSLVTIDIVVVEI